MIRVHEVAGKERGMMIIGTASELRMLADALATGLEGKSEKTESKFPELIAGSIPAKDLDQGVTFHLETLSADQPRKQLADTEVGRTIVFVLAVVGLVSTFRWAISHAL